jgi:hypothetical protein
MKSKDPYSLHAHSYSGFLVGAGLGFSAPRDGSSGAKSKGSGVQRICTLAATVAAVRARSFRTEVLQDDACVVDLSELSHYRILFRCCKNEPDPYFSTRIKSPLDAFTATFSL